MNSSNRKMLYMYVGSYTNKETAGISIFSFNSGNGEINYIDHVDGIENPSFLSIDAENNYLYSVSETMKTHGIDGGKVASYRINPESGSLTFISEQLTQGGAPCHLSINRAGDSLYVVNYAGGNICWFPVDEQGQIGVMSDMVLHEGKSIRSDRQEGPHPHSIILDDTNQFAYVPDLGLDKIIIYQLDDGHRKFLAYKEICVQPGAGPRHLTFHPKQPFAYVINELDCTINVFALNEDRTLTTLQTISTLQASESIDSSCADIHISPCGNFLYGSNRGDDSLAIYQINQDDGLITHIGNTSTGGRTPRNFAITPNGKFLLAANQDSDLIVVFEMNQDTGHLSEINSIRVSEPVCIKFL